MSLESGSVLGPYVIRSAVGKGGMGEVYRATDSRLGRDVAIKVLPERLIASRDALKRFEREAKALAALSHPNILTIHDVGTQDSISYVVMELLEGETLRTRMERSTLSISEVLDIATQIARGLAAAHSKGVIHRDLKPENIFLTTDGHVKVLDFGLARFAIGPQERLADVLTRSFETQSGTIMGTAPYMSPEQLLGEEIDARTDIFSFGVLLYEMITGKRPFGGKTTTEIMASILKDHPSTTMETRKDVPAQLDSLILRCLSKPREERFPAASDLLAALLDIPTSGEKTVLAQSFKQRILYRNLGMMILIALFISGMYLFFSGAGRKITSLAVLPFQNAGGDPESEYISDGITETLINNMSGVTDLRIIARTTAFTYKGKEVNPTKVGNELKVEAVLMGKVVHRKDDLTVQVDLVDTTKGSQIWGERYMRKLSDIVNVEQEIARQITERLKIELSGEERKRISEKPTQNIEAYHLYLKGRYQWNKRTEEGLQKARDYFQEATEQDPTFARAYAGLADVYVSFFDYELLPPEEATKRAKAAAFKALEIDPDLGEAHSSLAHAYLHEWKWSDSENEFRRAIQLDPGYATTYHWYALCLTSLGRTKEAVAAMKKAAELDPLSLRISADLGMALLANRQFDEAIQQETKTLDMDSKFRVAYWIRGMALEGKGEYAKAIEQFQQALKLSPNNPNYLAALGHAYGMWGKKEEALRILKQLQAFPKEHGTFPFFLALVYTGIGDRDSAIQMLEQSIADRSGSARYLKIEPRLDPLRSDPRYSELIRKVGLPS